MRWLRTLVFAVLLLSTSGLDVLLMVVLAALAAALARRILSGIVYPDVY